MQIRSGERKEAIMSGGGSGWSDLPADVLPEIRNRLEVVDFIRFPAISASCRSVALLHNKFCRLKPQIPWILASSTKEIESRYMYDFTRTDLYKIHLPHLAGQHFIGSSHGFVIGVDQSGELHIVNPLTGSNLTFPSTVTQAHMKDVIRDDSTGQIIKYIHSKSPKPLALWYMRYHFYKRAILRSSSEQDNTIVVLQCGGGFLDVAFARSGDTSWTALECPLNSVEDIIFHKGRLHAIDFVGTLVVFDLDNPSADPPFVSPVGPLQREEGTFRRFLVESPDGGDLFLVLKETDDDYRFVMFKVFKLNKVNFKWYKVRSIGNMAMFLGFNHSVSFSTCDFPNLQKNCIYFTYDESPWFLWPGMGYREESSQRITVSGGDDDSWILDHPEIDDTGVYNLKDGSFKRISFGGNLQHSWPPPIWFTPTL